MSGGPTVIAALAPPGHRIGRRGHSRGSTLRRWRRALPDPRRNPPRRFYTDWYLQRYGFFEIDALRRFLNGAAFILDAGTGAGRDAANLAENSEATVFAVDTAREALEIARDRISQPQVAFVHADLHRLPLSDEFFDFINCDQVIHHTPDPRAAFEILRRKLKPRGPARGSGR